MGLSFMESQLPLEKQFRLRAIKQQIDEITSLEEAKKLLFKCFEYQFAYEHALREFFKAWIQGDIKNFSAFRVSLDGGCQESSG